MPQLWPNRISEAHPELLHSLGTFLPHGVHKVPVAVQGEGHRIVARVRGNRLGIVAGMLSCQVPPMLLFEQYFTHTDILLKLGVQLYP